MANSLKTYATEQKVGKTKTPQTVKAREDQVRNNAGGFVFKVSDKDRLERFLILGTDNGTYYVTERNLVKQNVAMLEKLIASDERMVVDTIVDVSTNARASKNTPALFALALVLVKGKDKAYARAAVPAVARTSTHLFEFAEYIDSLGGWGRAKRGAIADWYTSKDAGALAYQAVKYRQRNGWTHRDLFRLSHPKGVDARVGNFILGKGLIVGDDSILSGFAEMQACQTAKQVVGVLNRHKNLPWETIPTQFLNEKEVWKTLFYNGAVGQTALLRNVTRFAKMGLFNDLVFTGDVAKALADEQRIVKGRMHPVQYANALGIYRNGRMSTGGWSYSREKDWTTNAKISAALEAGFYASFKAIEPANKPTSLWLDVSGSMTAIAPAGLVGMSCAEAAAVMAMVTLRSEPYVEINGFCHTVKRFDLSASDSLAKVTKTISNLNFGATNCALPMQDALKRRTEIDTFVVYTDNETYAGRNGHPFQALKEYRSKMNREARLAVVGMAATDFTIADPSDRGMMDFVGFDSNAPKVLADFSAGRI